MHYKILYNPLSEGGLKHKGYKKLIKKLTKNKHTYDVCSLLEIDNLKEYLSKLDEKIKIVVVGGDGTLHYFVNRLVGYTIKNDIYLLKAGTGNDFARSIKLKNKLTKINKYINNLPYDEVVENEPHTRYFINSAGMGVDAYVCDLVNRDEKKRGRLNYFKNAYRAFKNYKPYKLTVEVDGKITTYDRTWIALVANSGYAGGGMKFSPKSNRLDDQLEVIIIHNISKFFILLLFPIIYFGWHIALKKRVKVLKGNKIKLTADEDLFVQYDGETSYPRRMIDVTIK